MPEGTEQHLEHAEHVQHQAHNPFDRKVAMTMAILAAGLACVTMLGHRAHNETLVAKTEESDQWNYYQAKKNRQYLYEADAEMLQRVWGGSSGDSRLSQEANKLATEWKTKKIEPYTKDAEKIKVDAEAKNDAAERAHLRANFLDWAELALEFGLVLCSISVLTKARFYWYTGIAGGLVGACLAVFAYVAHHFIHVHRA